MGIGVSILLMAVGAVLTWAVSVEVSGVSLDAVGVILMVVGAVGLIVSLVVWGPRSGARVRREQVVDDHGRGYERVERINDGL